LRQANFRQNDILPGVGLGPIVFGMTISEVESVSGTSLETQREDGDGYAYIVGALDGAYLFFDQSENFRLFSIEVDELSRARMFGQQLFPGTYTGVLDLLRRNLPRIEVQRLTEIGDLPPLEEVSLNVRSLAIKFCFDTGSNLREVHWGPLFDSDDEIVWPKYQSYGSE
jgi:hypothetical protein